MRQNLFAVFCIALICAVASLAMRGAQARQPSAAETPVARGHYLVEEVAKCSECHTPRDADMQLERSRWLQGAPIWIEPVRPVRNWAQFAPSLAGLAGYSDDQMERVLEMGEGINGRQINPPMHIYHMTHADAQAIVAYLRSLPTPTAR
jgi:mono/diheme cytochrome c family protein